MTQKKALLLDISICIGCNACQAGCKTENKLPADEEKYLSLTAFTALDTFNGKFVRRLCQHCEVPTCVSVCPVGALEKTAAGPVVYDADKCIGCRYCMQACPFRVPRYEWNSTKPRIRKCTFCAPRQALGMQTACAEACPTGATKFGDRDAMVVEAVRRIQADPGKYVARIYGREDVGGTSMLYVSPVPFEQLGFDVKLGNSPMPLLTHQAMEKIPSVVTVGSVLLAGIWWITGRRKDVQRAEGNRDTTSHNRDDQ
jgi:formate dehydrogenase iron-sulfur subunit